MIAYPYNVAMLSHQGRVRKGNEDSCNMSSELGAFVVCDGMGGAAAGEIASQLAANTFLKALAPEHSKTPRLATPDVRLKRAVMAANKAVWQQARRSAELSGMGTTLIGLLLDPAVTLPGVAVKTPRLALVHVGDSRCYRYRGGRLELLTNDHSLVGEQVRMGGMTAEQGANHPMRNIITRAVGSQGDVEPEMTPLDPEPGDIYLLASDGLTRELEDEAIAQTISRAVAKSTEGKPNLGSLCQTLIDEANDAGGGDNITVLLLQLV